jgi:alanyl-tRNA synthetase
MKPLLLQVKKKKKEGENQMLYENSITGDLLGTRRIEAVAGTACIDWYRRTYQPIPDALKLLRANDTDDMVGKIEKSMQQTKDLQKRIDFIMDKLATAGETAEPVSSKIKGLLRKEALCFWV